jgi:hypothetical protein
MQSLSTTVIEKIVTHSHKCKEHILWFNFFSICSTLSNALVLASHDHLLSHNRILAPEVHIIRSGRQMLPMETYPFPKRSKKRQRISLSAAHDKSRTHLSAFNEEKQHISLSASNSFCGVKRLKHDDQPSRRNTQVYRAEPAAMSRIQRAKT